MFMRACAAAILAVVILCLPEPTRAWGLDVHRFITKRAIAGLPAGLKPFYTAKADFISEHAVDPDMWRLIGLKGELGDEEPNHFLDIDGLDDPRPFKNVPRDWNAYVAKYGAERANREFYDDAYYAAFLSGTQTIVERRISEAASGVASVITQAWTDAGKPAIPATRTPAPVRIRR
jgi:hypothetical protein